MKHHGIGIVVDDAIVVGENVHEYRSSGIKSIQAAITGTMEMWELTAVRVH